MLQQNSGDNACPEQRSYRISPFLRSTDSDEVRPRNDEEAQIPHKIRSCDEDASLRVQQVPRHVVLAAAICVEIKNISSGPERCTYSLRPYWCKKRNACMMQAWSGKIAGTC